jgi:hypothetical protein
MRILHLGANTASQMDITVAALNRIGLEARGLCYFGNPIQSGSNIEMIGNNREPATIAKRLINFYLRWKTVSSAIRWADIVHCYVGPRAFRFDIDLCYISWKKRGRIVEFLGSDIRTEDVAASGNPYLRHLLQHGQGEYAIGFMHSRNRQRRYAKYGFRCATSDPELIDCVMPDLFPSQYLLRARVDISRFEPRYPSPNKHRPLLVHMPSNPRLKGTSFVMAAVEELRKSFDFDFRLLQGMEHDEALQILQSCDLMLDQFVIGTHGVASIEAMAFGKPVISYIKPIYLSRLPPEFPIVNATADNLEQVTASLLRNPSKLCAIGLRSRAYVEKYHSADRIARQLHGIYSELKDVSGREKKLRQSS